MSKVKIRATPEPANDPQVRLSARDASAAPGQRIRWRTKNSDGFKFKDLGHLGVFTDVMVKKKTIYATFSPPEGDPPNSTYVYTIFMERGSDEINSDYAVIPPTGGKAVIRN